MSGVTLRPRDLEVWRALHGCSEHWKPLPADGGFLPLHVAQVLDGRWTHTGITVALRRLEQHCLVEQLDDGRWVAKGDPTA